MAELAKLKLEIKDKKQFLLKASELDGVYVPSLMEVEYNEDGTIKCFKGKTYVKKAMVRDLDKAVFPHHFAVASSEAVFDRGIIEVMRGCYRGCRFCQAGFLYRPVRKRGVQTLTDQACSIVRHGGFSELSLNSLSTGDYDKLGDLLDSINASMPDIKMSLPSLRVDSFESHYAKFARQSSITFAPEAGTQRLRDVINKDITEEEIMRGAENAFKFGYSSIKLYFMMGLPTEREEDMKGIAHLCEDVAMTYYKLDKEYRKGKVSVGASCSFFVPKPFTPFQWAQMSDPEEYQRRAHLVNDEFKAQHNHRSLSFKWHDAKTTVLEGILARGDRRLCKVIYDAYQKGCLYDAWTE
jgi:radical SAM family uncharacterized protein